MRRALSIFFALLWHIPDDNLWRIFNDERVFTSFFYASLAPTEDSYRYECRTAFTLHRYKRSSRISVSFWNENLNKLIHKWLVSNNFTLVCDNRDELVLEQNSFRYHVKGPKEFLFPEHHALLSCQNTINFNSVEARIRYAATETTISDHKSNIL